jgi:hypothetical protein
MCVVKLQSHLLLFGCYFLSCLRDTLNARTVAWQHHCAMKACQIHLIETLINYKTARAEELLMPDERELNHLETAAELRY